MLDSGIIIKDYKKKRFQFNNFLYEYELYSLLTSLIQIQTRIT